MVYKGDIEQINAAYAKYKAESARHLIGQDKSAIREQLQFEHQSRDKALSDLSDGKAGDVWYGGSVDVKFGLIYGDLTVRLNFGDNHKWEFSGTIWGFGAGTGAGVGGGPWRKTSAPLGALSRRLAGRSTPSSPAMRKPRPVSQRSATR